MKYELKSYQSNALSELMVETATARREYIRTGKPQVISLTAPTGSGKTIIAAAFIESVFKGNEEYIEKPDTIFLWVSDSPELNEQSKLKIEKAADKLRFGQCVTIDSDSFDREYLEDGRAYFLNTQKLSKASNLVKRGDGRSYTFWDTLRNTIEEKSDRLIVIIDEAHRGMRRGRKEGEATTIMQKFILGTNEEGMEVPPCPVVIGMTATGERFDALVSESKSTKRPIKIPTEAVKASGLLKDEVFILYPDEITAKVDMAVLQSAANDWKKKCEHWEIYYKKYKTRRVDPVFLVQVENGTTRITSNTDLDEVIRTIEERVGYTFGDGEIVHAFGEKATLTINGRTVRYEEPSRIDDNKAVKVVLFKDALSTGWDCPRAETMVSFRKANDATYIAQLVGRMFRTPLQQRVFMDEYLNTVYLYLPYFNRYTVDKVIEELKDSPVPPKPIPEPDPNSPLYPVPPNPVIKKTVPKKPSKPGDVQIKGQYGLEDYVDGFKPHDSQADSGGQNTSSPVALKQDESRKSDGPINPQTPRMPDRKDEEDAYTQKKEDTATVRRDVRTEPAAGQQNITKEITESAEEQPGIINEPADEPVIVTEPVSNEDIVEQEPEEEEPEYEQKYIDRPRVIKYINDLGIQSYEVRKDKVNDYLKSLFILAGFLHQTGLYGKAVADINADFVKMIHGYVDGMKSEGTYRDAVNKIMEFSLSSQAVDVFGESVPVATQMSFLSTTDTDIERQFSISEKRFKNEGVGISYCRSCPDLTKTIEHRIEFIMFVNDAACMGSVMKYAEKKYHELIDVYHPRVRHLAEKYRAKYRNIINDGDAVSGHDFILPEYIARYPGFTGDKAYTDHLYVDEKTRDVRVNLNGWEAGVLDEERKRDDFISWLRNPERRMWSLCIPYEKNGINEKMYPDFLIIRDNKEGGFCVDILEPHDDTRTDNVWKAKGLARYADNGYEFGRVQLIRKTKKPTGGNGFKRLDMSKSWIRAKIKGITTNYELDCLFEDYGFFD